MVGYSSLLCFEPRDRCGAVATNRLLSRAAWPRRSPPGACMRPAALVLRNGSAHYRPLPQVLEAQQHGQHPFELSVEMNLVAAEPL
jgi:hypothetical protein